MIFLRFAPSLHPAPPPPPPPPISLSSPRSTPPPTSKPSPSTVFPYHSAHINPPSHQHSNDPSPSHARNTCHSSCSCGRSLVSYIPSLFLDGARLARVWTSAIWSGSKRLDRCSRRFRSRNSLLGGGWSCEASGMLWGTRWLVFKCWWQSEGCIGLWGEAGYLLSWLQGSWRKRAE